MLDRLREPSSWAALAAVAAIFRPDLAPIVPAMGDLVVQGGALIAAAAAVFTREKGR